MLTSPQVAPRRGRASAVRATWTGLVTLGALLRVYPWTRPNGFLGVREYDDGVYYGTAKFLLHGLVPYRDFVMVHPPGISLLLVPFAVVGEVLGDPAGLACARVAVVVVALVNLVLVGRLAQRLAGGRPWPGLAAAAVYAVSPNALAAEHTVLLEPVVTLFCLLAVDSLTSARPSRFARCGVLLGIGLTIKLFAAAYLIVILVWLLVRGERRAAGLVVAGLAGSVAVLVVPFAVMAPRSLWNDVVVTQLSRPNAATARGLGRLLNMTGLSSAPQLVGGAVLLLVAGLALREVWSRRSPGVELWLVLAVVVAGAFFEAATYFPHYGAFLAPALGVLAAQALSSRPFLVARVHVGALVLVTLLSFLAVAAWHVEARSKAQADVASAKGVIGPGQCVFAQTASLAVAVDVLQVPRPDCPAMADQRGVVYTTSGRHWAHRQDFYYAGFTGNVAWQDAIVDQLDHADYLLLLHNPSEIREWSSATQGFALTHFRLEDSFTYGGVTSMQLWGRVDGP